MSWGFACIIAFSPHGAELESNHTGPQIHTRPKVDEITSRQQSLDQGTGSCSSPWSGAYWSPSTYASPYGLLPPESWRQWNGFSHLTPGTFRTQGSLLLRLTPPMWPYPRVFLTLWGLSPAHPAHKDVRSKKTHHPLPGWLSKAVGGFTAASQLAKLWLTSHCAEVIS